MLTSSFGLLSESPEPFGAAAHYTVTAPRTVAGILGWSSAARPSHNPQGLTRRLRRSYFVYLHDPGLRVLVGDPTHHLGLYLLLVDLVELVFFAVQVEVSFGLRG